MFCCFDRKMQVMFCCFDRKMSVWLAEWDSEARPHVLRPEEKKSSLTNIPKTTSVKEIFKPCQLCSELTSTRVLSFWEVSFCRDYFQEYFFNDVTNHSATKLVSSIPILNSPVFGTTLCILNLNLF